MAGRGKISIEIDGDEYKAVQSYANLTAEQRKLLDELGRVGKKAEEVADKGIQAAKREQSERRAQIRMADNLVKKNETVSQSLDRQKKALDAALKAGTITQQQYDKTLAAVKTKANQAATAVESIEPATEKGFGTASVAKIAKFATSFVSVAAAVQTVRKALEFYNREKEKAIGSTESLTESRTSLRQVSQGDFDELEARSDALTKFGINRIQARQLAFAGRSTGFEGQEATVAKADVVIPIEAGARFAGEFRQQFSGDNLRIEEAFDTALTAAEQSVFNITELLPQIQKAAQGAKGIGASSSDVAAVTSVFAGQFGEAAGRRVRSLEENILAFNKNNQNELAGLGFIDVIKAFRQDTDLRDRFIGSNKELATAVNAAVNSLDDFTLRGKRVAGILRVDAAIERSQRRDVRVLEEKVNEALDPETRSGRIEIARRKSIAQKAALEISQEERFAEEAFAVEAAKSKVLQESTAAGDTLLQRFGSSTGASVAATAGGSPETVGYFGKFVRNLFSDFGLSDLRDIRAEGRKAQAQFEDVRTRLEEMQRQRAATEKGNAILNDIKQGLEGQSRQTTNVVGVR